MKTINRFLVASAIGVLLIVAAFETTPSNVGLIAFAMALLAIAVTNLADPAPALP